MSLNKLLQAVTKFRKQREYTLIVDDVMWKCTGKPGSRQIFASGGWRTPTEEEEKELDDAIGIRLKG